MGAGSPIRCPRPRSFRPLQEGSYKLTSPGRQYVMSSTQERGPGSVARTCDPRFLAIVAHPALAQCTRTKRRRGQRVLVGALPRGHNARRGEGGAQPTRRAVYGRGKTRLAKIRDLGTRSGSRGTRELARARGGETSGRCRIQWVAFALCEESGLKDDVNGRDETAKLQRRAGRETARRRLPLRISLPGRPVEGTLSDAVVYADGRGSAACYLWRLQTERGGWLPGAEEPVAATAKGGNLAATEGGLSCNGLGRPAWDGQPAARQTARRHPGAGARFVHHSCRREDTTRRDVWWRRDRGGSFSCPRQVRARRGLADSHHPPLNEDRVSSRQGHRLSVSRRADLLQRRVEVVRLPRVPPYPDGG